MTKPSSRKPNTTKPEATPEPVQADPPVDNGEGTDPENAQAAAEQEALDGQASPPVVPDTAEANGPTANDTTLDPGFDPVLDGGEDADVIFADEHLDTEQAEQIVLGTQETPADAGVKAQADPDKDALPESTADVQTVRYAGVEGFMRRVPMDVVKAVLGRELWNRASSMQSSLVSDLQTRMRATDGRCAPMIFTVDDINNPEELPKLFAGLEIVAAAIAYGARRMFVVILPASGASFVQGMVASAYHQMKDKPTDDVIWGGMTFQKIESDPPA